MLFVLAGIVNILLWHNQILSIYGFVFGIIFFILAMFVFHFSREK